MNQHVCRWSVIAALVLACASTGEVRAEWPAELSRLPETPNTIALVDAAALRALGQSSKAADRQELREFLASFRAAESTRLQRVLMAAWLDLDSLSPSWEAAIGWFDNSPTLAEIAKGEDGYIDELRSKRVVWSPRNAYFMPLERDRVAVVRPANRQLLTRWLSDLERKAHDPLGAYLTKVSRFSTEGILAFLALELGGAISPVQAREKLQGLAVLKDKPEAAAQAAVLAEHLQGCYFVVKEQDGLLGRLQLEFDVSASPLNSFGVELIAEMLELRGLEIEGVREWQGRADNNVFSLTGTLRPADLARIMSLLRTGGSLSSMSESARIESQTGPVSESEIPAQASKRYFDSTRRIVDSNRDKKPQTVGQRASWNDHAAREIDDLPILHVDEDLLGYGSQVAALLRDASLASRQASMQGGVQVAGQSRTVYNWNYYGGWNTPNRGVAQAQRQARATGTSQYLEAMQRIDDMTAQIRREMTKKYQLEF